MLATVPLSPTFQPQRTSQNYHKINWKQTPKPIPSQYKQKFLFNQSDHINNNNNNNKNNRQKPYNTSSHQNPTQKSLQIINKLLRQNSQLRKIIYSLEYQLSIKKIEMENKQIDYKNIIGQYRNIVKNMLLQSVQSSRSYSYSTHTINNLQQIQRNLENIEKVDSWRNRRKCLYTKFQQNFQQQQQSRYQNSKNTGNKNIMTNANSYREKQKEKFIRSQSVGNDSGRYMENIQDDEQYQQYKELQYKHFSLNPNDYLIFNTDHKIQSPTHQQLQQNQQQQQYNPNQHIATLTSVTDPMVPHLNFYQNTIQIQQNPTVNLICFPQQKQKQIKSGKAETQRKQKFQDNKQTDRQKNNDRYLNLNCNDKKNKDKAKKSSGRMSSQAQVKYSNQSFQVIVEKGMKNRIRIQQMLKNWRKQKV